MLQRRGRCPGSRESTVTPGNSAMSTRLPLFRVEVEARGRGWGLLCGRFDPGKLRKSCVSQASLPTVGLAGTSRCPELLHPACWVRERSGAGSRHSSESPRGGTEQYVSAPAVPPIPAAGRQRSGPCLLSRSASARLPGKQRDVLTFASLCSYLRIEEEEGWRPESKPSLSGPARGPSPHPHS